MIDTLAPDSFQSKYAQTDSDNEPLLGVVTLEILGLVFDPFHRTLHPMRALLI